MYKPKGKIAEKLYKIAEKIRYEKIGSNEFRGIEKNISSAFNFFAKQDNNKNILNKNKKEDLLEEKFDIYLRSLFFKIDSIKTSSDYKKIKKEWDKSFRRSYIEKFK